MSHTMVSRTGYMTMQFTSRQTYDNNFYAQDTSLYNLDWMILFKKIGYKYILISDRGKYKCIIS